MTTGGGVALFNGYNGGIDETLEEFFDLVDENGIADGHGGLTGQCLEQDDEIVGGGGSSDRSAVEDRVEWIADGRAGGS